MTAKMHRRLEISSTKIATHRDGQIPTCTVGSTSTNSAKTITDSVSIVATVRVVSHETDSKTDVLVRVSTVFGPMASVRNECSIIRDSTTTFTSIQTPSNNFLTIRECPIRIDSTATHNSIKMLSNNFQTSVPNFQMDIICSLITTKAEPKN